MIQNFFSKLLDLASVGGASSPDPKEKLKQDFMRHEAEIGGKIFGPVPEGRSRKFFCLDDKTLIWHEEWIDSDGRRQLQTTRYEIRSDCVLKSQDGKIQYQKVEGEELSRLVKAARLYNTQVKKEIYNSILEQA